MKILPGEIFNTDLMKNSVPGLIPQITGFLSSAKFHYASFFIDDRSDFTFVCNQKRTTVEETINAKRV